MTFEYDVNASIADVDESLKKSREAFKGKYKDQINDLAGLSKEQIDEITPDITDLQKYDELTTVVKEASRLNLSQAQIKAEIEKLGSVAVEIAKRVPSLSTLLV